MPTRKDPPSSVMPFPRPARAPKAPPAKGAAPAIADPSPDLTLIQDEVARLAEGITESLALLQAIDLGELLGAVPAAAADRRRHETAVGLLSIQDRLLQDLLRRCQRLQALE